MSASETFDKHYKKYEKWFEENKKIYLTELKAVKKFVPENKKGLEIGIGTGRFAKPLEIKIGVEPSEKMRKIARDKGLKVYEGVGESLPFANNKFDFILMVTTICFLDDIEETFAECKRVLKENGKIIIGFVDKNTSLGQIYLEKKEESVFYREANFHSTKEVINWLKQFDFKNVEVVQTVFGKLSEVKTIQDFKEGYGEGGFVVIKAEKSN